MIPDLFLPSLPFCAPLSFSLSLPLPVPTSLPFLFSLWLSPLNAYSIQQPKRTVGRNREVDVFLCRSCVKRVVFGRASLNLRGLRKMLDVRSCGSTSLSLAGGQRNAPARESQDNWQHRRSLRGECSWLGKTHRRVSWVVLLVVGEESQWSVRRTGVPAVVAVTSTMKSRCLRSRA